MEKEWLLRQIKTDLTQVCVNSGNRHVGSPGNIEAGNFVAERMKQAGFQVKKPEFDCIDWEHGAIILRSGRSPMEAFIGPYSPSCELESYLVTAANVNELASKDSSGKIALFHGELCREQIIPRNFEFYNPDKHQRINRLLDEKKPLAVIAITSRNPELAGGQYPFPLFEDGDFDIPSAYLTEEEGEMLLSNQNTPVYLKIESRRIPSRGFNVIGSKQGSGTGKIVFCAHFDAKKNSPGALDNGTGVVALLALAELLKGYTGKYDIELLAVNGEDYYAAPGQMNYISSNREKFDRIVLAVNIDGAGFIDGKTSYCCLECNENIKLAAAKAFGDGKQFVIAEPWYQSDHGWFVQYGVPAVAITSENFEYLTTEITHTPKDSIEKVNISRISEIAYALNELIKELNKRG
jgi:aminopeptidase YwaD